MKEENNISSIYNPAQYEYPKTIEKINNLIKLKTKTENVLSTIKN